MTELLQDIRYSFRFLRKSPGFAAIAILTLALGIGANTAISSIVKSVLLNSLPFPHSDSLVKVTFDNPGVGLRDISFSYPEFDDIRTKSGVFDEVSVVWPSSGNLTGAKEPVGLGLVAVSPNYFSMLGVIPELGRLFGRQDDAPGFAQAAVISDALWRQSYGADPSVIGKNLQIDNDPYTIVGVAPANFHHPGRTVAGEVEVWLTAGFKADPFSPKRNQREIPGVLGRLKPGMTLALAQARLGTLAKSVQADFPEDYPKAANWSIEVQPLQRALTGDVRPTLLVLMGAALLIILLASVNIANLLLARASGRQQETAIRIALGAKHSRMIRLALTESVVLSLIAGVCGIATAVVAVRVLARLVPATILPEASQVRVDWVVMLAALVISILTGLLFGLAPALQSLQVNHFAAIREGGKRSGYSSKTSRLRGGLIISEVSLAVILMVAAGLLLRTFWGLLQEYPGFNATNVISAGVWLPAPNDPKTDKYGDIAHQSVFLREVLRRMDTIPGVTKAAIASALPASGAKPTRSPVIISGRSAQSEADQVEIIRVSPDYFRVLETPLRRGRFFSDQDDYDKQMVVITDESTARRYWPGQDSIGKQMKITNFEGKLDSAVVVGVVGDIKHDGLDQDGVPHVYTSIFQTYGKVLDIVAQTPLPPPVLEAQVRSAVQTVDPSLPVFEVRSLGQVVGASLAVRRFAATLVAAFAGIALLLATVGIYGLLAYVVGQRSAEIGIRMALGANRAQILGLFLKDGLRLAGIGVLVGVVFSLVSAPAVASLLYHVRPLDAPVFLMVPTLFFAVAFLACIIPASRAARLEPMASLRQD